MDDFVWLYHPEINGWFNCPPAAVNAWVARGWVVADGPPPEDDQTRDEPMRAALREALEAEKAHAEPATEPAREQNTAPAKPSRRSAAATEGKE